VSVTWPAHANSTPGAPFVVLDNGVTIGNRNLDQRVAPNDFNASGFNWEDLGGPYTVTSGLLQVRLSTAGTTGYVRADAVRIEQIGAPAVADIEVLDGATDILDETGLVDFGSTTLGAPVTRTFTVRNAGTAGLTLGAINVPSGFTLTSGFGSTTLIPGATTSFTVRFDAAEVGPTSGVLSFATNDADENPFNFAIAGTAELETPQIVDDGGAGWSSNASWFASGLGGFSGDSRHNNLLTNLTATWSFTVTPGATYRVSVTWPAHANSTPGAPFVVLDNGVTIGNRNLDQRVAPNDFSASGFNWEDLGGPYTVTSGLLQVRLSTAGTTGYVRADAVRIEQVALRGTGESETGARLESFGRRQVDARAAGLATSAVDWLLSQAEGGNGIALLDLSGPRTRARARMYGGLK
jgi:hypothetical protein